MHAGPASAQSVQNEGDCNVIVQGSGNTNTVNCYPNEPLPASALLVLTDDAFGVLRFWQSDQFGNLVFFEFYPGVVVFWESSVIVEIDGEEFSSYLDQQFGGGDMRVEVGQYPFSMRADVRYSNGFSQNVICRGILDIQSSAELAPYFNLQVDPMTGRMWKLDCGFSANPV